MENETRRHTPMVVALAAGLPALPYLLVTRGLWTFPGCPPESLEYPGHPAPSTPLSGSIVLVLGMWAWFAVCLAVSLGIHRSLRDRRARWLRVLSFVAPVVVSVGATLPCLLFVGLATLC